MTYHTIRVTQNEYHEDVIHGRITYNYWLKHTNTYNDVDHHLESSGVGTNGNFTYGVLDTWTENGYTYDLIHRKYIHYMVLFKS